MSGERIWQAVAAGLAVLWLLTFAYWAFRQELAQGQWLTMFRDQLIQSVQTLAQQQQGLEQRLKALETRKGE